MSANKAGLQPDRLPEKRGAFPEALLLKANGAQH
jgi:hypothetical protein